FSRRGKIAAWVALVAICALSAPASMREFGEGYLPGALVSAAGSVFDATRVPLFIFFYAGLALVLWEAFAIRELRSLISQASQSTMRITAMVVFILIGSALFTLVFPSVGGGPLVRDMLIPP